MDHHENLKYLYLLERPTQPLYVAPRGHGTTRYLYNLPPEYLEPYQAQAMIEFRKMIPPTTTIIEIPVYKTAVPYDLTKIQKAVPRTAIFSEFNQFHLDASAELTNILLGQGTKDDFFNACALCRDVVNPHLWIYAFTKAVSLRPDMRGFKLPAVWEVTPDMFIESIAWQKAVEESTFPVSERPIIVIDKNFSGIDLNPEHKVAYFAEDIAANAHHWHWHLVYPANAPRGQMDRRGEIFYYMHHNMLARYDAERLSNGLNRTVPFDIHKDVIEIGYFPKLSLQNASVSMAGRQSNSKLQDLDRTRDPDTSGYGRLNLQDLRAWAERVVEAIDAGFAIQDGGGRIDLRTDRGIDVVTAMWEPSNDTPHRNYYGTLHNFGHTMHGFVHDPDYRFKEPPGPMYWSGTSMRDCAFYRWHRYLDYISQRQKDYLQPYHRSNLFWSGISISEIQMVRVEPSKVSVPNLNPLNNMVTHWMQSDIELNRGLDFGRSTVEGLGPVWVRTTHLQHVPFVYRIKITSQIRADVEGTIRIFMAPKLDENADKLPFFAQRILFFEMDKFTVHLHPGENVITQRSEDSTLTIPWLPSFRDIENDTSRPPTRAQAMCHCGWPEHMLLPRGKPEGMLFDLFIMITPTQIDQVPSSKEKLGSLNAKGSCKDSISFCGLIDDKFPDSRPMGFPFDRPAIPNELGKPDMFLADFVSPISNMATQEVKVFHVNKTIQRENGAPRDIREVYVTP